MTNTLSRCIALLALVLLSGLISILSAAAQADSARTSDCHSPSVSTYLGEAHTVMADGHPLAVWSKSPADPQAAILLVHGRTWSGRPDFDLTTPCEDLSLMNGLADAGFAAYAVDMRGYGKTPRDATGWLTPNRAAADVAIVMQWLNAQSIGNQTKAHLFGWSYGATMAQLMTQQKPTLAQTLTLFGYAVRPGYDKTPADLPATPPAKANTYSNAISDFIVPDSISKDAIAAFATAALNADPVRADWRALEQWGSLDGRKVLIPTLLIQAEFDPLTRKRVHRRLFSRLTPKDSQWVVIKGGDHAAFMEKPRDKFLQQLTGFLQANTPPAEPEDTATEKSATAVESSG